MGVEGSQVSNIVVCGGEWDGRQVFCVAVCRSDCVGSEVVKPFWW